MVISLQITKRHLILINVNDYDVHGKLCEYYKHNNGVAIVRTLFFDFNNILPKLFYGKGWRYNLQLEHVLFYYK